MYQLMAKGEKEPLRSADGDSAAIVVRKNISRIQHKIQSTAILKSVTLTRQSTKSVL